MTVACSIRAEGGRFWRAFRTTGMLACASLLSGGCADRRADSAATSSSGSSEGTSSGGDEGDDTSADPVRDLGAEPPLCVDGTCPKGQACIDFRCRVLQTPPPCEPLELEYYDASALDGARAITFADLDADGSSELVGVFDAEMRVLSFPTNVTSSPRDPQVPLGSNVAVATGHDIELPAFPLVAMVSGQNIAWQRTGGDESFEPGASRELPFGDPRDLVVGAGDVPPPRSTFIWSQGSAGGVFAGPPPVANVSPVTVIGATVTDARWIGSKAPIWGEWREDEIIAVGFSTGFGGGNDNMLVRASPPDRWETVAREYSSASPVGLVDLGNDRYFVVMDRTYDIDYGATPLVSLHLYELWSDEWSRFPIAIEGSFGDLIDLDLDGSGHVDLVLTGPEGGRIVRGLWAGGVDRGPVVDCQDTLDLQFELFSLTGGDFDGDGDDEFAALVRGTSEVLLFGL